MTDLYYSTNEEVFDFNEPEGALCDLLWFMIDNRSCDGNARFEDMPEELTIFEGEFVRYKASDFVEDYDYLARISECAWEESEDCEEDWPNVSREAEDELDAEIRIAVQKTVDAWAEKHGAQPTFGKIENVRARKFKPKPKQELDYTSLDDFIEVTN